MSDEFEIGLKVMVPMRGMCRVTEIKEETILGQSLTFVHLKPSKGKGIFKMPIEQLEGLGIRPLVGKEEVLKALEQKPEVMDLSDLNSPDRMERWAEMMRSGDYGTRLQVLREISHLDEGTHLDDQEKKFKKQVRLAARREIESALGTSAAGAGRRLNLAIGK